MESILKLLSELLPAKEAKLVVVAVGFCVFYPFFLFTCYMADRGFFAHEAFGGVLGLVVPFLFMAFLFALVMPIGITVFWSGIISFSLELLREEKHAEPSQEPARNSGSKDITSAQLWRALKSAGGPLLLNLFMLGTFAYITYHAGTDGVARALWYIIGAWLLIGLILVGIQRSDPAARSNIYIALFVFALLIPPLALKYTTKVVEGILTQFRLGGVMVTLVQTDEAASATPSVGRLVFLSSSNLYLHSTDCPPKLTIMPRGDTLRLDFASVRTEGIKDCPEARGERRAK